MIELRRGVPGDGARIAATRQKCWAATYRGIFPDEAIDRFDFAWHTARDEQRLKKKDFFYELVLDGAECVGYVSYGVMPPGQCRDFRFRLQSLYLLPEYQKTGLGRRILERVKNFCIESGFDKMCLDCHPQNTNALDFYRHMGGVVGEVDAGHENPQEDSCTIHFYFS